MPNTFRTIEGADQGAIEGAKHFSDRDAGDNSTAHDLLKRSNFHRSGTGGMGRPLRMYEADAYYFVTARCFQSRLLLRPSAQLMQVLGGVLARAARLTKVELCGFVAASNHVHLLCRARDGALSDFMKYFLANVSKKAGRLVDWRGQFWERRFSAEPVLDDGAMEGRLIYILSHGVKEGLVRKAADWPGFTCLQQLLGESKRTFPFHEWAKRWESGKLIPGGEDAWAKEWATTEELELHPLPAWREWTPERRRARVRRLVADIEAKWNKQHPTVIGVDAVKARHPHARPRTTKKSNRPWFHSTNRGLGQFFMAQYASFVSAFRRASEKLRAGALADFPPFSFAPFVPVRV